MTTEQLRSKVDNFLSQKRIAVVGVSRHQRQHPAAQLIYNRLKSSGHEVFPVNPLIRTFQGDTCYPDVGSIPGGVDGAVVVTRPETTEKIARDCADAGVPRVWMHSSVGGGSSVSQSAVDFCGEHGMTVIAGGCPMMFGDNVDFGHTCMRWLLRVSGRLPG